MVHSWFSTPTSMLLYSMLLLVCAYVSMCLCVCFCVSIWVHACVYVGVYMSVCVCVFVLHARNIVQICDFVKPLKSAFMWNSYHKPCPVVSYLRHLCLSSLCFPLSHFLSLSSPVNTFMLPLHAHTPKALNQTRSTLYMFALWFLFTIHRWNHTWMHTSIYHSNQDIILVYY